MDLEKYKTLGIIKNQPIYDEENLNKFFTSIKKLRTKGTWTKDEIVDLYFKILPEFNHKETGKYLDQRM